MKTTERCKRCGAAVEQSTLRFGEWGLSTGQLLVRTWCPNGCAEASGFGQAETEFVVGHADDEVTRPEVAVSMAELVAEGR